MHQKNKLCDHYNEDCVSEKSHFRENFIQFFSAALKLEQASHGSEYFYLFVDCDSWANRVLVQKEVFLLGRARI